MTTSDGRQLVDLAQLFGASIFGHGWHTTVDTTDGLGDLHATEVRDEATRLVCTAVGAPSDWRALILHSGSEAVETALKTAILATGRTRIVAFEGAYHGTFGLALAVTHRPAFREPFAAQHGDHVGFCQWGQVPQLDERVAAVVVEPIQGRSGVVFPPDGWLAALREACTASGALLVLDAVLAGSMRTGAVAESLRDCAPDVVCLGKALGAGLPASAVAMPVEVAEGAWGAGAGAEPIHTATFVGHSAAAAAILNGPLHPSHADHVEAGTRVAGALSQLRSECERAGIELRGKGALWALDGGPGWGVDAARWMLDTGYIVVPAAANGSCITLTPSLRIEQDLLDAAVDALTRLVRALPTRRDGSAG